jgi:ABC-type antimicrobial peptide transport system permease subunit
LLPFFFRRSHVEGEMKEELRSHIRDRADDLERSGLPRAEAERRARTEFGGYQKFKEECREELGTHFLDTMLQDLRHAPGFTAIAILTLALGIGANTKQLEIVGVVGHIKQYGLDENLAHTRMQAQFYASALQLPDDLTKAFVPFTGYMIRTQGSPDALAASIRDALRRFNSKALMFHTETMDNVIAHSLASRRFAMTLLAAFAALALALSSIGIYGVISYIAGQRANEIGIRIALGAQRKDILRIVLGHGARLSLTGVAVGLVAAAGLTRLMTTILYGVNATDRLTFVVVVIVLTVVALMACYIPARRAMKVDPVVALKHE